MLAAKAEGGEIHPGKTAAHFVSQNFSGAI
jgi:hypothetical protein